ncbi:class I SAM-dependent DNA methyltransferase [Sutcliffiella rhizosphaerae]|uniref:Ubiquinone biosynthesis O-methyltransferase, mitochondrial n=1 Tax=Sutcliffiella rhizosphaerae TaxID=2880967 RepID=A0ABM8YHY6_9BACI|nr:class I SAM-dependent methyltransferase [Sutcliffiella rhizosphaerae]CAG9619389.1 Ubiquinone biosynthesis O-methyltransferase, mitochondrial [Sutcliffiella rhizosphaerae]
MAYGHFAYIYDYLMKDVPYQDWVSFVKAIKSRHTSNSTKSFSILDVGCGTGELTLRFANEGWKVAGVDLSESMLAVAHEKAEAKGLSIPYYEQNMAELEGFSGLDCITIFCDSLNYLESENDVKNTFQSVYQQLADGGLFLFDVHSVYKMSQVFMNNSFNSAEEEVAFIWNSFQGEHPNSVEHELSFFVQGEESNVYTRFDELHKQRTYSVEMYKKWLEEIGFTLHSVTGDFSTDHLSEHSERVFFVAQK